MSDERLSWIRSVIARYEGPLIRYATNLTGEVERARDVVQDTFHRLCEAERSAIEGHVAAWLYRVCRNRALDVRRKDRPMRLVSDAKLESQESPAPSPSAAVETAQSTGRLLGLLPTLSEKQQEVLRLKFQEGLSYREIASVTGQSVTNVGYLIHTALRSLRERLEDPPAAPRLRTVEAARSLP